MGGLRDDTRAPVVCVAPGRGQRQSPSRLHRPPPVPSPPLRGGRGTSGADPLNIRATNRSHFRQKCRRWCPPPPATKSWWGGYGWGAFEMTRERHDPRTLRARELRRDATPVERRLWRALRLVEVPEGHFPRQAPVGPYVADFANHSLRLVVELDGEQHGHSLGLRRDAKRTAYLAEQGYRVLRFWNHEVVENLDGVVETILAAVAQRAGAGVPLPPRRSRGGEGTGKGPSR